MVTASDRLHVLYELNRRLTTFTDLVELVRFATRRTRELLEADGCSLLLLDRSRREFSFPVASQSEARAQTYSRLVEIRFPADEGIAGWVFNRDEAALVPDAQQDSRFYGGVDRLTGLVTHDLLCAPLRTRGGNIGVIQVINTVGGSPTTADLEFLEAIANDVASAYEKAELYGELRTEAMTLRRLCTVIGIGLLLVGALLSTAAVFSQLARALPLIELISRPGMWIGTLTIGVGTILTAIGQGWLVPRTSEVRGADH